MLVTLIKNELIKLLRKWKTWIVFGLFIAFIGITIFAQFSDDKNMREWQSPEKQLEMSKDELKYVNEDIKNAENDKSSNPEYIQFLEDRKIELENRIASYEEAIKTGVDENAWKVELDERIKNVEKQIEHYKDYNDQWTVQYRLQAEEELEMFKYLKENNIKPLYGWEYEAYGYMKNLMQFLGMAILLCGIAVFMSDIVSGECTPATLKFLLIQPVTRGKVLLSKFIAVTLTVLIMILGGEVIGFGVVNLTSKINAASYPVRIGTIYKAVKNSEGYTELVNVAGSGHIGTNLELFLKSMLFQGVFIIATCAVVFLISTLIKSSMITMAVSVVVTVFLTIGSISISALKSKAHLLFVNFGDATSVLTGNSAIIYNNANMTITNGIIVMVVTAIVAYVIAHINFKKKDILI